MPVLILALLCGGCNASEEPAEDLASGSSEPGIRKGQKQNRSLLRKDLRTKLELPDFYPEDAPIYPGSMTNNSGRRKGRVTAVFSTEDSTEQLTSYVLAKLGSLGWTGVLREKMPNGEVIRASKEAREISVLVASMDPGTEYELTMMVVAVDP